MRATSSKAKAVVETSRQLTALKQARKEAPESDREMLDAKIKTVAQRYNRATEAAQKHGLSVVQCATQYKKLESEIARAEAALARVKKRQENSAKRKELQGEMVGAVATVMTVAAPVTMAMDFESAFADAKKVMDDFTESDIAQMPKDIRKLSKETGLAAADIAGIYAAAASAKIATSREELQEFASTAAQMAVAFGMSAADAGQRMSSWRAKMGLSQAEVVALSDAINHLGNNMAADPLKTSEVVERVGAVAKTAGLATHEIAAMAAGFVAASPSPEIAATGMKNFLLTLAKGTAMSKDQKESFARLGFDPKLLASDMQKDAETTVLRVLTALRRMPEAEQASLLSEMFGTESLGAIAPMLQNLDGLKKAFGNVAKAESYAGSMTKEYESRSATTKNALLRLRRGAESLGIGVGSVMLPPLAAGADAVSTLLTPVIAAAEQFPMLTTAVMGVVTGLVVLKVGAIACGYAATILSDGWLIAKGVIAALRPTVIATNAALVWNRGVAIASAVATKTMTVAQWALNAAMTANPIGLVIAGVVALGAAVWALYTYCEPVRRVLDGLWDGVSAKATAAWGAVTGGARAVVDWLGSLSLYDVGVKLLTTFTEGIKAVAMAPVEAVAAVVTKVREYLPGSDAERGPLSTLTASGAAIPATMAQGMNASGDGGLGQALDNSLGLRPRGQGGGAPGGAGLVIHFAPTINVQGGGPELPAVIGAQLQLSEARLREMLENLQSNGRRLAYA
ncbi:phage tail tape measure protein, TP901 family, core region [Humidesulfovibrio mexicanus]|uniref:Phage tail tape measure protein, TP901 family, core region n=2 Tax=Humidesulfovibrio mexicanus TaxID=147047 RepID=A0A239C875_9BACT|nr:phage tail tape measure protein, TP901 family, core region [Humidesulfovibrio mexicanus]